VRRIVLLAQNIVDIDLQLSEIRAGIAFDKELEELMKGQMEMNRRLRKLAQN
jgi:hypothetical protein